MEINGIMQGLKAYDKIEKPDASAKKTRGSARGSTESSSGDSVKVSNEAKLVASAMSEAQSAPDIRQKKIDELKALVQSGEYVPDLKKTAAKLVEEDLELLL